jgi:hypothetical protein
MVLRFILLLVQILHARHADVLRLKHIALSSLPRRLSYKRHIASYKKSCQ